MKENHEFSKTKKIAKEDTYYVEGWVRKDHP
jgi:hypothetical protein